MPARRSGCPLKADRHWRFRSLHAATTVRRGGVVLYPTEGVWGLGCDPHNPQAIRQLLRLKGRRASKGLILLLAERSAASRWVDIARVPTPDPTITRATTWLVPARRRCSPLLRGAHRTVAIRVTRHAPARTLCALSGGAVTSTSANRSGFPTPTRRWAVLRQWGPQVDAILSAPLGGESRPSRIFDTVSGQWIRP